MCGFFSLLGRVGRPDDGMARRRRRAPVIFWALLARLFAAFAHGLLLLATSIFIGGGREPLVLFYGLFFFLTDGFGPCCDS